MGRRDFAQLIRKEGAKLHAMHAEIHRTFALRDRDPGAHREWEQACNAFHAYQSWFGPYLESACKKRKARYARGILEFVVCFLEVDPWFYRSGYLKQVFLTRVKRSVLSEALKERLRKVVLDAVERRGTREFKYYCRLAVVLADQQLVAELETAAASTDAAIANRARMMLGTVRGQRPEFRAASSKSPAQV